MNGEGAELQWRYAPAYFGYSSRASDHGVAPAKTPSNSFRTTQSRAFHNAECRGATMMYDATSRSQPIAISDHFVKLKMIGWGVMTQRIIIHVPKAPPWYHSLGPPRQLEAG